MASANSSPSSAGSYFAKQAKVRKSDSKDKEIKVPKIGSPIKSIKVWLPKKNSNKFSAFKLQSPMTNGPGEKFLNMLDDS